MCCGATNDPGRVRQTRSLGVRHLGDRIRQRVGDAATVVRAPEDTQDRRVVVGDVLHLLRHPDLFFSGWFHQTKQGPVRLYGSLCNGQCDHYRTRSLLSSMISDSCSNPRGSATGGPFCFLLKATYPTDIVSMGYVLVGDEGLEPPTYPV